MKLRVTISNIKSIKNLTVDLPLEKGLYALTGENATGKSTISMCASALFYHFDPNQYFGRLDESSRIKFEYNGQQQILKYNSQGKVRSTGKINVKGFFEGSLIFGNRFRNATIGVVNKLDAIDETELIKADDFVRENLGLILCNDKSYYKELSRLKKDYQKKYGLVGIPYFYSRDGIRVHQAHMSTGEYLMLSILHSLKMRIDNRGDLSTPCLVFLDEIELALHASALRRLIILLNDIANRYNMAIYFSTHSIELIRDLSPERIFYIQKYIDGSIGVLNPCYPAYATKNLYDSNLGYDDVILVEDDLARMIIYNLLREHSLLENKLVCVLPCGGWQNVIRLANDILQSNLLGAKSKLIVVLDGDIETKVQPFLQQNNITLNTPLNYLPVPSLEKHLKESLYDQVDQDLTQELNNYIFHKTSLTHILQQYKNNGPYKKDDKSGKELFTILEEEAKSNGKGRADIIDILFRFIHDKKPETVTAIVTFLKKQL